MARARGLVFSFLWGISLIVFSAIVGGVYFAQFVDKIRFHYASESWNQKTVEAQLGKTDKLNTDRFVSVYPVFRVSDTKLPVAPKPSSQKNAKLMAKQ